MNARRGNTADPLIERWANVERVLAAMPEHDREHHWSMSTWGEKTDCGTIACAAGHCGLDPWFRKRGFKLDFLRNGENKISDVAEFFGFEGSKRIFFNSKPRSVATVLDEVRGYLGELRRLEELMAGMDLPSVGEDWPAQGGIFAGARVGTDGAPDYLLIVGPEASNNLQWKQAVDWAAALVVGEHRDFVLPDRSEGTALFDRVQSLFQKTLYWLSTQHAGSSSNAWAQHFNNGNQYDYRKVNAFRARAVRRLPIRSFDHSVISETEVA